MKQNKYRIKDLPEDQRPREKLLKHGADKLNEVELLAVLLRTGTVGKSSLELAKQILDDFGGYRGICGRELGDLKRVKGLGPAKIAQVAAAFEIASRIIEEVLRERNLK